MSNGPTSIKLKSSTSEISFNVKGEPNWLVSFIVAFFVPLTGSIPFLLLAASYGSINPEDWGKFSAAAAIMIAIILAIFGISFYLVRERKIDVDRYIDSFVEIDEYKNKKYLDYLMSHYGNVCALGALIAVSTLGLRWAVGLTGITAPSILAAILIAFSFLAYGVLFLKAVFGAIDRSLFALGALLPMVILDASLLRMIIQSIPS